MKKGKKVTKFPAGGKPGEDAKMTTRSDLASKGGGKGEIQKNT